MKTLTAWLVGWQSKLDPTVIEKLLQEPIDYQLTILSSVLHCHLSGLLSHILFVIISFLNNAHSMIYYILDQAEALK